MENITVVIPVRIDCPERLRNLQIVLQELCGMGVDVWILEADEQAQCQTLAEAFHAHYLFEEDKNVIFHRTRYLNRLLRLCETPVVGIWDADVVLCQSQIQKSVEAVMATDSILSIPYNGVCHYLSPEQSAGYAVSSRRSEYLHECFDGISPCMRPSVGGAFVVNRERYLGTGGENESFYGWGPEDAERVHRVEILGYPVHRVSGFPLYHLWHPRNRGTRLHEEKRILHNWSEFVKVCSMDKGELLGYIKTW